MNTEDRTRLNLLILALSNDSCLCSAEDVCDSILRSGARLNLPVLPALEHIAGQKWELPQLPGKASPWVDEMCMHAQIFRERLSHVKGLSHANVQQVGRQQSLGLHGEPTAGCCKSHAKCGRGNLVDSLLLLVPLAGKWQGFRDPVVLLVAELQPRYPLLVRGHAT